jgi:hypothetical protein
MYLPGTLRFNNCARRFAGYFYLQRKRFLPHTLQLFECGSWRKCIQRFAVPQFCKDPDRAAHKMTRSQVLLNCRNPKLIASRIEAWEGRNPGNVRRLLTDPKWEKRFVRFLELSGVGRTVVDGTDEESAFAARMDTWIAWETEEEATDRIGLANEVAVCCSTHNVMRKPISTYPMLGSRPLLMSFIQFGPYGILGRKNDDCPGVPPVPPGGRWRYQNIRKTKHYFNICAISSCRL